MRKIYVFMATAIVALASCTNDTLVNDVTTPKTTGEDGAIAFSTVYKGMTRADYSGGDAAAKLKNNFVVEGIKWDGGTSTQEVVFDHYNVNWVNNTANTTTSNTANWEYVAQTKHDHASIAAQSIKYWDYAKSQYDFIAFSAGEATAITTGTPGDGEVLVSKIDASKMNGVKTGTVYTDGAYTIQGKADDLAKVYIADLVTAYRDPVATGDYQKEVNIKFRSLSAKVRVALYETVPGYSVKDVVFYTDATTAATDGKAHLFTEGGDAFNEAGKYIVYFPTTGSANKLETDYNKAHVAFEAAASEGTKTVKNFESLDLTNTGVGQEVAEANDQVYLGRASSEATYAGDNAANHYTVVIPNETGAVLNLKVNYTLVSTDGSGETINVTGATAQVPAVYGAWKSGYAYTYIFKISRNTNGVTNPYAGPAGLYPITFDATVVETEDGIQETITTVATPSITTYAKGAVVTANNEYTTGSNIYAVVENGAALTVGTNANLYTVTLEDTDDTDAFDKPAQTINEASVANAIANGGAASPFAVTDANKWKMTVTAASGLAAVTEIAAADAPDGNAITVNGAKFKPAAPTCTAVTSGTTLTDGNVYYTSATGEGRFVSNGTEVADGTNYFTVSTAGAIGTYVFEYIDGSGNKYYKIIKVVD